MMKTCRICLQTLPLEAFAPAQNAPDGHRSTCETCVQQRRERKEKPCQTCGEVKPMDAFPRNKASDDGHQNTCIACRQREREQIRKIKRAQWRATNLLGGCLETLRGEFGGNAVLERISTGERKLLADVLGRIRREAPQKLYQRAGIEYDSTYYDALYEGWDVSSSPDCGVATVWYLHHGRRQDLYHVFTPAGADMLPPSPTAHRGREEWRQWARDMLASEDWIILDTETTDKRPHLAQVIEVAAVDMAGNTLIEQLVRPAIPIPPDASKVNGITDAMVADAPLFANVYTRHLQPLLSTRKLLIYNASYDVRVLQNNIKTACGLEWRPFGEACLMETYAAYQGGIGRTKLEVACAQMGIKDAQTHRALGDCQLALALLRAMAE